MALNQCPPITLIEFPPARPWFSPTTIVSKVEFPTLTWKWKLECPVCGNFSLRHRRPKDGIICHRNHHVDLASGGLLILTWQGKGPMPVRKS